MKKTSFIVVDDSSFMRSILKKMIEEHKGYTVLDEGKDGHEAIKLAAFHMPDVITLDITMPGLDGIEAVRDVLRVSPETKIIMISAMGHEKKVVDAIKRGAKDFIIKPFDKTRVMNSIKKVLE